MKNQITQGQYVNSFIAQLGLKIYQLKEIQENIIFENILIARKIFVSNNKTIISRGGEING